MQLLHLFQVGINEEAAAGKEVSQPRLCTVHILTFQETQSNSHSFLSVSEGQAPPNHFVFARSCEL